MTMSGTGMVIPVTSKWYSCGYPARRMALWGQRWDWCAMSLYTFTRKGSKCDLQLLSQCGSTCNCSSRSVPVIHKHVAGMLSNQATNNNLTCQLKHNNLTCHLTNYRLPCQLTKQRPHLPTNPQHPHLSTNPQRPHQPTKTQRPHLPTNLQQPDLSTNQTMTSPAN